MPASNPIEALKIKRQELGLSQAMISRLLRVSENTIRRWELGAMPRPVYQQRIQELLDALRTIEQREGEK